MGGGGGGGVKGRRFLLRLEFSWKWRVAHWVDKRILNGVKWGNWDLPIFLLGKWDFIHWDWDSSTKNNRKWD